MVNPQFAVLSRLYPSALSLNLTSRHFAASQRVALHPVHFYTDSVMRSTVRDRQQGDARTTDRNDRFSFTKPRDLLWGPMSRMTGAVPPLPVYHRGADMENITLVFTPKSEVKVLSNGRRTSPRTAIRQWCQHRTTVLTAREIDLPNTRPTLRPRCPEWQELYLHSQCIIVAWIWSILHLSLHARVRLKVSVMEDGRHRGPQ